MDGLTCDGLSASTEQGEASTGMDPWISPNLKSKRMIKKEEKESYKLPHRLIEKKRRDRINECIAQLKELLPEHLKLAALGHLEKAVVLELAVKHLQALTALCHQQQQRLHALHTGEVANVSAADASSFTSGFQSCVLEVQTFLDRHGSQAQRDVLLTHLQHICGEPRAVGASAHSATVVQRNTDHGPQFEPDGAMAMAAARRSSPTGGATLCDDGAVEFKAIGGLRQDETNTTFAPLTSSAHKQQPDTLRRENCVPVIQRVVPGDLSGSDTDTDSGYGGETERAEMRPTPGGKRSNPTPPIIPLGPVKQARFSEDISPPAISPMLRQPFCMPLCFMSGAYAPVAQSSHLTTPSLLQTAAIESFWYGHTASMVQSHASVPGTSGLFPMFPVMDTVGVIPGTMRD
uniref:class E basic helix-loop-helix protein 40-like isoform X2 n=1 Tax=Myxine glutinosa TaxID=7769 RepID=UPI00358EEEE6